MQYIVTEYKRMGRGKVELCLNENRKLWLYAGEARNLSLEEGAELTEDQFEYMLHEVIGKRAIKRAMHLLERQERTEHQLREKLLQNEYPGEAIEDAVSYVKNYHYLDDERYARTFIHYHQENRSRMRIQMDLMRRGISKNVIEICLEEEFASNEQEQIRELLKKKRFSTDTADDSQFRKTYQFLMRRGFKSQDILKVMKHPELEA